MKNRVLICVAIGAIGGAGVAAHFLAQKSSTDSHSKVVLENSSPAVQKPVIASSKPSNSGMNSAELAVSHLRDLFAQDPTDQAGRAAEFLNHECRDQHFETALQLVDAVPRDLRADWLKIIFDRWAQAQPEAAMSALDKIGDADERAGAFQAAVAGWNSSDPGGLAEYAAHQPASDNRDYALTSALENWSMQDPTALATWLNTLPRGAEFDYGAALMLAKTDSANRSPELAMKWVENIGDPALKQTSFQRVIAEWLQTDSAAAKQYVTSAAWLDDSVRSRILAASRQ